MPPGTLDDDFDRLDLAFFSPRRAFRSLMSRPPGRFGSLKSTSESERKVSLDGSYVNTSISA